MSYLFLLLGFILLIKGADWFVDGSSNIAKKLHVSPLIIGLTVVAFGTSTPEVAVSVSAALSGSNAIAVGNVVGSNIFNLLMVGGICGAIAPLKVEPSILKKEFPFSILIVVIMLGLTLLGSTNITTLTRIDGIILLLIFAVFMYFSVSTAMKQKKSATLENVDSIKWSSNILLSVIGVASIIAGGELVVNSAVEIATAWGVSQTVIGLTIVAIGTSLPELVTSVVASNKGERDIAMGNIIGSNLFNVLFVLGISASIHPITVSIESIYDMILLIGISIYAYVLSYTGKRINRIEGISMVVVYVAYMAYILIR